MREKLITLINHTPSNMRIIREGFSLCRYKLISVLHYYPVEEYETSKIVIAKEIFCCTIVQVRLTIVPLWMTTRLLNSFIPFWTSDFIYLKIVRSIVTLYQWFKGLAFQWLISTEIYPSKMSGFCCFPIEKTFDIVHTSM